MRYSKILFKSIILATMAVGITIAFNNSNAGDLPGEGQTVIPADDQMLEGLFQTTVLIIGLEQLGYNIEDIQHLDVPAQFLTIAQGDAHFTAQHWIPQQQGIYEKAGGDAKMEQLGILIANATQGYLIDMATAEKHSITNIEQLKDPKISALFDSDGDGKANLAGCPPGWGCETVINHHIEEYGLSDTVTQDQGNFAVIASDVLARYRDGQPVLYYTYTPLWFSEMVVPGKDARWLEVPYTSLPNKQGSEEVNTTLPDGRNVGWELQNIVTAANRQWVDANPAARKLFELVEIPIEAVNAENRLIYDGENKETDVRRHAKEWVAQNQAQFDAWVMQAKAAAQ